MGSVEVIGWLADVAAVAVGVWVAAAGMLAVAAAGVKVWADRRAEARRPSPGGAAIRDMLRARGLI